MEIIAIIAAVLGVGFSLGYLRVLGRIAKRLKKPPSLAEQRRIELLEGELHAVQQQLAQSEEKVAFLERLLEQRPQSDRLPPG